MQNCARYLGSQKVRNPIFYHICLHITCTRLQQWSSEYTHVVEAAVGRVLRKTKNIFQCLLFQKYFHYYLVVTELLWTAEIVGANTGACAEPDKDNGQ